MMITVVMIPALVIPAVGGMVGHPVHRAVIGRSRSDRSGARWPESPGGIGCNGGVAGRAGEPGSPRGPHASVEAGTAVAQKPAEGAEKPPCEAEEPPCEPEKPPCDPPRCAPAAVANQATITATAARRIIGAFYAKSGNPESYSEEEERHHEFGH